MPTPFTHLVGAMNALNDPTLPDTYRRELLAQRPAYLLGATAPDARVEAANPRAATHFYTYEDGIDLAPWRVMLNRYPTLQGVDDAAQRAFIAGYVAHLAMDEMWTRDMLGPHFALGQWGASRRQRFFLLHLMLIDMDERDLAMITPADAADIQAAQPTDNWLPFMPLDVLAGWQELIYEQVRPGGYSRTYDIFGGRVERKPDELRRLAADSGWMQVNIWDNVSREVLAGVEAQMAAHALASLAAYLGEFTALGRTAT
jgi:hypothetical protein